ncbi:MAG: hypothetical protein K940chlam6_00973 [Chlamydiae bacterium]|nr:hypothetical protein [Chlamydiota bacterium]
MSSVPPVDVVSSSFSSPENPDITQVIEGALIRLQGKVLAIAFEEILDEEKTPDRDHNYKISLTIKKMGETEPASLFALNLNGNPKKLPDLIKEMTQKIENHLSNREKEGIIKFDSGAMLEKTSPLIENKNGYLCIDGKIVVMKREEKYMPLPTRLLQSYTIYQSRQEDNLIILSDDHEQVRDDGKEGMIVHLKQGILLKREQLDPHPKDLHSDQLAESATYLILYRKREDVPKNLSN